MYAQIAHNAVHIVKAIYLCHAHVVYRVLILGCLCAEYGIYVRSVAAGSDAAAAGIKSGDRIVSMDGREIGSSEDVDAVVKSHTVGDKIKIVLKRYTRSGRTYNAEDIELEIEFTEYKPN